MALLEIIGICLISTFGIVNKFQDKKGLNTPPSDIDYSFKVGGNLYWAFENVSASTFNEPVFTRTVDSTYFNYSYGGSGAGSLPFDVSLLFRRSNTTWESTVGGYRPFSDVSPVYIGSNSTVGNVQKMEVGFDNDTTHDFFLVLDIGQYIQYATITINDVPLSGAFLMGDYSFTSLVVPSGSNMVIKTTSQSGGCSLEAFYLTDLGVNPSYGMGVDQGEVGFDLTFLFEKIVGVLINFSMIFLGLEIMGISLIDVFGILLLIISVVWVFKLIKGG